MMYDNANDANRYLAGTIAYWDNEPVYVSSVERRRSPEGPYALMALVTNLPIKLGGEFYINISDPRFNCMKYQLGYCNTREHGAVYITRRPARIQSQGICGANLSVRGHVGGIRDRDLFPTLIRDAGFVSMLKGEYPSVDEARKLLHENRNLNSVAFEKNLGFKRHKRFSNLLFLIYKGDDVAYSDSGEFTLPEEFRYLYEVCQSKGCIKAA